MQISWKITRLLINISRERFAVFSKNGSNCIPTCVYVFAKLQLDRRFNFMLSFLNHEITHLSANHKFLVRFHFSTNSNLCWLRLFSFLICAQFLNFHFLLPHIALFTLSSPRLIISIYRFHIFLFMRHSLA